MDHAYNLQIVATLKNFRALWVESNDAVVGTHGRHIVQYAPPFIQPRPIGMLPLSGTRLIGRQRLIHRLLRLEIYRMVRTPRGADICTSREGILRRGPNDRHFYSTFSEVSSVRPISLCCDRQGRVYFGEYFDNADRCFIRVFVSEDDGKSWCECFRFGDKTIRHIHGLIYDSYRDKIWVMTGDYGDEAKIALASPGFSDFSIIAQGSQQTRACDGICRPEGLIYATDTPSEQNHILSLNPETGQSETLAKIQNSVLFMGQGCGGAFASTIVEPSPVNTTEHVHVWYSPNARHWSEVFAVKRDRWSLRYFQYPTASFALSRLDCPYIFISFRSVAQLDGDCLVARLPGTAQGEVSICH